jgi:hypothetical protein
VSEFSVFSWVLSVAVAIAVLAFFRSPRPAVPSRSSQQAIAPSPSSSTAFQRHTFEQLQSLLVSYPSARHLATQNSSFPARNLVALFTPLDQMLQQWGYEAIGEPWQAVPFDPQLHQPDAADIQPGETVYIRFIGYRKGAEIFCPAKVSRSLPQIFPAQP